MRKACSKSFELIGMVCDKPQHDVAYLSDQYDSQRPWYYCNDYPPNEGVHLIRENMFDSLDMVLPRIPGDEGYDGPFNPAENAFILFYKAVGYDPVPLIDVYNFDQDLRALATAGK